MSIQTKTIILQQFHTCYGGQSADKVLTDAFTDAVTIDKAFFLLAANFLIPTVPKEALWASTDSLVSLCCALGISTTDHWAGADVLALEQTILSANAGVSFAALLIVGAAGLKDADTSRLAGVEGRALAVVGALANAASSITQLVVQAVS